MKYSVYVSVVDDGRNYKMWFHDNYKHLDEARAEACKIAEQSNIVSVSIYSGFNLLEVMRGPLDAPAKVS